MKEVTAKSLPFPIPASRDVLTEKLREGAQKMLAEMIQAEVEEWIAGHAHLTDARGRRQVVRNGHLPERGDPHRHWCGSGASPRVHDRRPEGQREAFRSAILPPYLRKTKF